MTDRPPFTFAAIGIVRSPYADKALLPRQPDPAIAGTVELLPFPGVDDAISDLASFTRIWLVFVFDRAGHYRPRVQPPRSDVRRGVLATRSPHRPNPIGLSAVELLRVEGRVLHVAGLDILDGTPVLDIKPYIPYADAFPEAGSGWLDARDPIPPWTCAWSPAAEEARAWLETRGVDLREPIERLLALGPTPHAYRRIRKHQDHMRVAYKEWRVDFEAGDDRTIRILAIHTGYRPAQLHADPSREDLALHRAFCRREP